MAEKKNNKTPKKSGKKESSGFFKSWFGKLKPDTTPQAEVSSEKVKKENGNRNFLIGSVLAIVALYMLLAMVSHLFTGAEDQKLYYNSESYTATNWMGMFGYKLAHYVMDRWFGVASIFIPVFLLAASIRIMNIMKIRLHKWFLNCMILMVWCSAFATYVVEYLPFARNSYIIWGGMIGREEMSLMRNKIGPMGVPLVLIIVALLYLAYVSDEAITTLRGWMTSKSIKAEENMQEGLSADAEQGSDNPEAAEDDDSTDPLIKETTAPFEDKPINTSTTIDFKISGMDNTDLPEQRIEKPHPAVEKEEIPIVDQGMEVVMGEEPEKAVLNDEGTLEPYDPKLDLEFYKYPTLDLLKQYENKGDNIDMEEQTKNKNRIIQVLSNFGVEISSIKATIGPTITLYEITPAPGVRISRIRNLEDDIALSLSALGIRIIAPIPGKGTIGIEVPNAKPQMVSMESILNSRKFQETDYELPMALGKTITNEVFMVDLAKMPHLLVAGATGQGKSVGLNAIITSLLYKKHPAELKFVMVDPKKVEFSVYNPIVNHFLAQVEGNEDTEEPIITDVNKVIQTLKSLCVEMDTRYDLLKRARARNVKEYNQKFKNRELNPEHGHKFMPYIVVIIDEFGDLIMTAGKEIELPIARIAQLARAVGIHMIIATQRPTTNIITGTIKANFPARMAFKVASVVDSRTILDRTGANQLVGKGDMLFLSGSEPVRVQCAVVDTPEVENIASYIACQQSYNRPFPLPEVALEGDDGGDGPDVDLNHLDPMFDEVARMVVVEQSGSTSMIQRKFSIGYNRAGRLMDQLEKAGVVGPAKGSKPREVLCQTDSELSFILNNLH